MKPLFQPLVALWQARAPRERKFLAGLALFAVAAALAQGLWSAHTARARLHKQIPQLRQQFETVQRQAGDIRQMQGQPAALAAQEGAALLASATTAARNAGLPLTAAQMQNEGPRQLRLRATLLFDRWLDAVAALQKNARLRLIQCRIDTPESSGGPGGSDTTGQARIDALFALPDPG